MAAKQSALTPVLPLLASVSFSRAGLAFWWATAWRALCMLLMFMLPVVALYFVLGIIYVMLFTMFMAAGLTWVSFGLAVLQQLVPFILNNVVLVILFYALAMCWMSRKQKIGSYTFAASYNDKPITTVRASLSFAMLSYLEILKYIWPMFIFSGLLGYASITHHAQNPVMSLIGLTFLPLMFYLHVLTLTDLLRRGTYSKNRCALSFTKTEV